MPRLENLLATQALAVVDRMSPDAPSEPAALVTLLAHPGRGVGWLADVLGLTDSGGTRLVERLVADGLLHRRAGADARSRVLRLTPRGERRARQVLAEREREVARVLSPLTPAERQTLERLLAKVVAALADNRPEALRTCRMCDRDACAAGARQCPLEHTVPPGGAP